MNLTESLVPRVLDTGMKTKGVHYYSWLIYSSYRINSKRKHVSNLVPGNPLNWTTKIGAVHACLSNQRTRTRRDYRSSDSETPAWRSLIKLAAAGICGTDIEKAHGAYGPGGILGHEVSGTIASVGDGVTDLRKSDRVIAHHHVPCYNCEYCRHADYTMCDLFKKTNFDPCGLAEYFRVPEANVTRGAVVNLTPETSFEEGSMIEPTACCV